MGRTGSPRQTVVAITAADAVSARLEAPTAGVTDGKWLFPASARPFFICNGSGQNVWVLINESADCLPTRCNFMLSNGEVKEISFAGNLNIKRVHIYIDTSGVASGVRMKYFP